MGAHCLCQEDLVAVERLAKGRAFHNAVQAAFLTDLMGATGFRERGWRLTAGGRGRVDLAVVTDDREKMLIIIIEIKGTDWDKIRADRVNAMSSAISVSCWPISTPRSASSKAGNGRASQAPCSTPPARPAS
jgi:hypothetical protein